MSTVERRTYGLWSRPRSEGLFGLAWPVTVAAFGAVVVAMATAVLAGVSAALVVAGVETALLAPLAVERGGRSGYETGIIMLQYLRGRRRKENIYRSGVFSRLGSARLPGILARSTLWEGVDSAGWRFGMIHVPQHDLYTVWLRCWPQGSQNVDQPMVDQWVGSWGQFLASLGGQADVVAITAVIATVPDTGDRLAAEIDELTRPDAPEMARAMMAELAETLPTDTVQLDTWCAVSFRATTPQRRRIADEQAVEIGRRLPGVVTALTDAGVRARPMTADEVTAVLRRSYDLAAETDLERAAATSEGHGLGWQDAGPIAYDEHKGFLEHDGAVSVSWEMGTAPEGNVDERVLQRLLAPNPELPRKRVALVYRPHAAADAAEIVDTDYKDALVASQSTKGVVSAHATLRVGATAQAREEQARGHGVTRFHVLITCTEPEGGDLPTLDALTKDLSTQARLKIRRCYRYQAAAFAASLGAGILLPEMSGTPKAMSA